MFSEAFRKSSLKCIVVQNPVFFSNENAFSQTLLYRTNVDNILQEFANVIPFGTCGRELFSAIFLKKTKNAVF